MDNYLEDESDDESDDELNDTEYEPEEISLTKYNIVLCEIYNTTIYGESNEAKCHYLTHTRLKNLDLNFIDDIRTIRPTLRLEIAKCIYLPSQHCISIIKTHWLKLIQRKWKKICEDRILIIVRRCHPNALKYREIYGHWPNYCINYPILKGMLSNLSGTFSRTFSRTSSI